MKPKENKRIKKIFATLPMQLLELLHGFGQYYESALMGKHAHHLWLKRQLYKTYHPAAINTGFYRLHKQGLVEKKQTNGRTYYKLTLEGEARRLMSHISRNKTKRADGYSTVVVFDIPEERVRHRVFLRRFLLRNGFINLQKSVLIGPVLLPKEFNQLIEQLKIAQNVTILGARIENWR